MVSFLHLAWHRHFIWTSLFWQLNFSKINLNFRIWISKYRKLFCWSCLNSTYLILNKFFFNVFKFWFLVIWCRLAAALLSLGRRPLDIGSRQALGQRRPMIMCLRAEDSGPQGRWWRSSFLWATGRCRDRCVLGHGPMAVFLQIIRYVLNLSFYLFILFVDLRMFFRVIYSFIYFP